MSTVAGDDDKKCSVECAFSPEMQPADCDQDQTGAPHLFDALTIKGVTLRNRIAVSPMCQYYSEDGFANDWHLVHLGSRAVGGAGLVMVEASGVSAVGRITPDDLGIYKDAHVEQLSRITKFLEQFGAVPAIQIAHAGRKASTKNPWKVGSRSVKVDLTDADGGWDVVAPSAIPFSEGSRVPKELTISEIEEIQQQFVDAAKRALKAGFKVLEIHAAHGYLLHSFYSPLTNKRADKYGGSFENRIRCLLEITQKVRAVWPQDYPLFVRLSCSDWFDGGWEIEDSVKLAQQLVENGVDLIDCSSGYSVPGARYPHGPGWQVPLAEAVKKGAKVLTGAVGEITSPAQAEQIITTEKADIVFLARQFIREPYWPYKAAQELHPHEAKTLPPNYSYAI